MTPPEYPQASRFVPAATSNYRKSSSARTISRIVIHITDGGSKISGPVSWFQNPKAQVSAHYIVGQDGEVVQMVPHNDVAWHARSANADSIGIEHVANTKGLMPTGAEYCASAALVNWLCTQYGIPMDRTHILGHSEADTSTTHTGCPNAVWDWNYYMSMVTSGTCEEHPAQAQSFSAAVGASRHYSQPLRSRPMAAAQPIRISRVLDVNFDVNWPDVQLIGQPTNMSCWAVAAAMVVGWRDKMSIDPAEVASGSGHWAAFQNGLNPADVPSLAKTWGLVMEAPQSYTVEGFRNLLQSSGPLWVAAAVPGLHAIVVTGAYGDGTPDGTYVRIKDPWGRAAGSTPGSPAPYNETPGQGSEYELTYRQFVQQYETAATDFTSVNIQILHSGSEAMRLPGSGVAQALSYRPVKARRPARTLNAYDINWPDVQLVPQPTGMSCWAAAASMVVGWRDQMSINPEEIARGAGQWAAYQNGLDPADVPSLANAWGLVIEPPQCYLLEGFASLLANKGPLWVAAAVPGLHAIVVTGLYGDGTPDGTYVRIKDPWGRAPGSVPGKPAPYNPSPGQGSQYELTYTQFAQEFETAPMNVPGVDIQILHAGGTKLRFPGAGSAQSFARGRLQRGMSAEAVVAGATWLIDKVVSNAGDVEWQLDLMKGKKHVRNDVNNEGSEPYRDMRLNVPGPRGYTLFGADKIWFDAEIRFQYNGRSIANVTVLQQGTSDALGAGLKVEAKIQDDDIVYLDNQGNRIAGMRVIFTYRFTFAGPKDDLLADTEIRIFGDGDFRHQFRWTQK
jgi:N-acetyl-anhydromuramyl-L-alanine amidase AmpD